jgi:phosphatidylserine/phosphatidylglycerophosphate/cardiolipin synthase-like enzyme
VYQNGDDALLVWNVDGPIDECRGFAIRRKLTHAGKTGERWLENYIRFEGEPHTPGQKRASSQWPFQAFAWTDHDISSGDSARYRVTPVIRNGDGKLELLESRASGWSDPAPNPNDAPTPFWAYFNRGYVISQFMSHYLADTGKSLTEFKETIGDKDDETIRVFLSGDLRLKMLELLEDARDDDRHVYGALYELGDEQLVEALADLGDHAHVVLANGSIKKADNETTAEARRRDQNEHERAALKAAGVEVGEHDRFLSPGALGHNKFLVVTDAGGDPELVWTGSTNWTPTGLCTQLNNGLIMRRPEIAAEYLRQWHRLRDAASEFPAELVASNSQPKAFGDTTVWFTRTKDKADLAALREEVDRAEQAILFLMFMPGPTGLLADVRRRQAEPDLFVRGVVSTLPNPEDESVVDLTMITGETEEEHRLEVIQPEGIANPIASWAAEVTRGQFLSQVGYAIVHSKVVVIDPFSDDATVITGSHNFSAGASGENDENFVIARRNRPLAEAYLVNIFGAWRHYRFRVSHGAPFTGLRDNDSWMPGALRTRERDAKLWGF